MARATKRGHGLNTTSERRVFLSASVPLPSRNPVYFVTADVVAIRDAIRALVLVAMDEGVQIVFGGHPAISPMIRLQVTQRGQRVSDRVVMFQSRFFEREFPKDNEAFETVVLTEKVEGDRDKSLAHMRERMLEGEYLCGVFIGGMEGVEDEYGLFRKAQPNAPAFPVASTGAAAANIYGADSTLMKDHPELLNEVSYVNLMRSLVASGRA